jgi:uncharacterized membrane protein
MSAQRVFVIAGLCAVLLFTFITPPFQVPDEVGHFWRSVTLARGDIFPRIEPRGATSQVEQGLSTIVFVFWVDPASNQNYKIEWPRFRTSWDVRVEAEKRATVRYPAGYTPVPYAPQTLAALVTRLIPVRPVITFYLGRLFNALAYIAVIAFAIRIAPRLQWVIAGAALLPMALYLAASWSPDAMTIALAFLFFALLLRGGPVWQIALVGFLVGLCKPAYFLIALLVLAIPRIRVVQRFAVIAATAVGVALAMWNASYAYTPAPMPDVDAAAQMRCLRADPMAFGRAFAHDVHVRGFDYVSQAVGRLGFLDVALPKAIIWYELATLVLCAWTGTSALTGTARAITFVIAIATIAGIAFASYLSWTPACTRAIEGIQGRYLLPIVPVLFAIFSAPVIKDDRVARFALPAVTLVANSVALFAVASRFYL